MTNTVHTEKHPILLWTQDIETSALEQAKNLANLPFIHKHVAIMPDAHFGYGMPIGGVIAAKEMVIPNGVGVDIGCGVCALQTSASQFDATLLKQILEKIRKQVPSGFTHHKAAQDAALMPRLREELDPGSYPIISGEFTSALHQLGTLGGGNHFIEMQKDDTNALWVMIHSGSRNLGYSVANHHNRIAIEYNKKHDSVIPEKWQLAALPIHSKPGQTYLAEMEFCVQFAFANRKLMMQRVKDILVDTLPDISFSPLINIAHNYASAEHHFKQDVIVHRKGATRALAGETGIIPGSQGAKSFIVEGKGNRDSFCSCSHGAGRKLGRKQAMKQLDLQKEIQLLEKQGIIHAIRSRQDLEEASGAYKNIEEVMALQQDLVEIKTILHPLAVIKG